MDRKARAKDFIELAEFDLETIKRITSFHPPLVEVVCFHAQQAAEKYLKALLLLTDGKLEKTHDLKLLCEFCEDNGIKTEGILKACIRLTDHAIKNRYEKGIGLVEDDMNLAIKDCENVKEFVLSRIGEN